MQHEVKKKSAIFDGCTTYTNHLVTKKIYILFVLVVWCSYMVCNGESHMMLTTLT